MARLPDSLGVDAPRGQRPSTDVARPTDFGLGQLAQGAGDFAQAHERVKANDAELKRQADAKTAAATLTPYVAQFESKFAEAANGPAAESADFSSATLAHVDEHFKAVPVSTDPGVQEQMRRQVEDYKTHAGQRAIAAQSQRRGQIVAQQETERQVAQAGGILSDYQDSYTPKKQALTDAYDGSQPHFAADLTAAHDEAAAGLFESDSFKAAPVEVQTRVRAQLDAQRLADHAEALGIEAKGHDAFVIRASTQSADQLVNGVLSHPVAFETLSRDLDTALAAIPGAALRQKAKDEYLAKGVSARINGLVDRGDPAQAADELLSGRYDGWLTPEAKTGLLHAARGQASQLARDQIEAMRYGADVDGASLDRNAAASGDPGLSAEARYRQEVGFGEAGAAAEIAGGGTGGGGFAGAVNFVIDKVEGGDKLVVDSGGPTRFGISQKANPDLNIANLTRPQAAARYRKYWAQVGADQLPPALALVAFDTAVNHGVEKARAMVAQSGGDPATLLSLRAAEYERLAKDPDNAKYLAGWRNRLIKVGAEAARIESFTNVQEGVSSDPVKYAMGTNKRAPLAQVGTLPDNPTDPKFGAALQDRLRVGQMMNRTYKAPLRLLTNGEAALFKDAIARDPEAAIQLAQAVTAAVGPKSARGLLAEVGLQGEAGVTLHIADLHAMGSTRFAQSAVAGIALKAKGAEVPSVTKSVIKAYLATRKDLFAGNPELGLVVRQVAEAAAIDDNATGEPKAASYYVNSALGATARGGKLYGGLVQINGHETIAPPWLAADHLDDVMDYLSLGWATNGHGPVYRDSGKPLPQGKISKLRPVMVANGDYQLVDQNGVSVGAKDGRPFRFSLEAAAPGLRRRFGPGVVLDTHR